MASLAAERPYGHESRALEVTAALVGGFSFLVNHGSRSMSLEQVGVLNRLSSEGK